MPTAKRLTGKRALVTGANRGIGKGIALRLAREGADVVVHYGHHEDEANAVAREIAETGARAHVVQSDMANVPQIRAAFDKAAGAFGGLDVLVCNAGIEKKARFEDVTEEDYDAVLDVNLKGVFFATQAMTRHLRAERRPGKIIHVSSVHEEIPFPGFAAYCASKGGVRMLTRTLSAELRGTGITVNSVAPGAIRTPINEALLADPSKLDPLLAKIPLGRIGEPDDVAGVVAFLASQDADYVTGSSYFVDGGLTWSYEEQ